MQFQACAYCDHPNPVGTNYCNDCGAALHLKPCRACGAVAVAKANQCPACKVEFPVRPTINVDIPWAVPNAPQVSGFRASALPPPKMPAQTDLPLGAGEEDLSGATTRAFAATQRLIEKASTRPMPQETGSELVLPARSSRQGIGGGAEGFQRGPAGLAMRSPVVADLARGVPFPNTAGDAAAAPVERRAGAGKPARRYGPAIFITLLGLAAAVALVYLVRYAEQDSTGTAREIASPHKLLRPAATPAPRDAATGNLALPASPPAAGDPVPPAVMPAPAAAPIAAPASIPAVSAPPDTDPYSAAIVPLPEPARAATPVTRPVAAPAAPPSSTTTPALASPAISTPAAATRDCRPELQALNLCGKVQQQ